MFEFSVVRKYLLPKRGQISVSLIGLMSIAVISLVTWLLLVFLSVTEGIEMGWLKKLTSLAAPLRITPTDEYYNSYYYKIDSISSASSFSTKTIEEKYLSEKSDPYDPNFDRAIPKHLPPPHLTDSGELLDPVKSLFALLEKAKTTENSPLHRLAFQDYEATGGLIRLNMLRPARGMAGQLTEGEESQSFMTQVSYFSSYVSESPSIGELILDPLPEDLNHLLYTSKYSGKDDLLDKPNLLSPSSKEGRTHLTRALFSHVNEIDVQTAKWGWEIPKTFFSKTASFKGDALFRAGRLEEVQLTCDAVTPVQWIVHRPGVAKMHGTLGFHDGMLTFKTDGGAVFKVNQQVPVFANGLINFSALIEHTDIERALCPEDIHVHLKGNLQNQVIEGQTTWRDLAFRKATFKQSSSAPLWIQKTDSKASFTSLPTLEDGSFGAILPKTFRENGVLIGDRGFIAYAAAATSSIQEQRIPIYVAGFYDPGVMSVGNRFIFIDKSAARTINASSGGATFDRELTSGVHVWIPDIKSAKIAKAELTALLKKEGIDHYWKISTYHDYPFAKDILEQFQSDKTLFSIVGIIILLVASCNIISLLVLMVNDKKKEIGIMLALGASRRSIASIFAMCGMVMGIVSCLSGTLLAYITLHNIDKLAEILSYLQGHQTFNPAFFGKSLPNSMSSGAILFLLIATPVITLVSGLIPAIRASKFNPSNIMREGG